jgi:hypothetical protein
MSGRILRITDVRKWGKYAIVCNTVDGASWTLKQRFACDDPRIRPTLEKIEAAGSIDPRHWTRSKKSL